MAPFDRRFFNRILGVSAIALAAGVRSRHAGEARARDWLEKIERVCRDVRSGAVGPSRWQDAVEETLGGLDLPSLLAELDFDGLIPSLELPDRGVATLRLPMLEEVFPGNAFVAKIFGVRKHRAVVPHGHRNMASAHLVLSGVFSLRQYDRLSETKEHMVIRQTVNETARPGSVSSISDERDNVHWLRAESERAFTLDLIVLDLEGLPYEIQNLDPLAGERIEPDVWRVPKIDVRTALEKYGKAK